MVKKVVVVGAGVVGLTTALKLKQKHPSDWDITVIGQHIPGDFDIEYTSPFAGANWHSFATKEDKALQEYDTPAYYEFLRLAKSEPKSGVWLQRNVAYYNEHAAAQAERDNSHVYPWFKDIAQLKTLNSSELPDGISMGTEFNGVVISPPIYLHYLFQQLLQIGVTIKRVAKLSVIQDAFKHHSSGVKPELVINCTGLLAQDLGGFRDDKRVFPVRGQVLHVRNNAETELHVSSFPGYDDETLYIMPRKEGGSIIGGCFSKDLNNLQEDTELTRRIIERATKYAPAMIDSKYKNNPTHIDIVKVNVGLRPFREGGVRVEIDPDHSDWLIHNYGAGGGGYQGSYGFAEKTVKLAYEIFSEKTLGKGKL